MTTVYFLIPVFNEEANLELLLSNLRAVLPEHRKFYVFSDDGSSDHSMEMIHSFLDKNEYAVLGDGINRGPGFCFNLGFEWILKHSSDDEDKVVSLEADNTSDLDILPEMLAISCMNFDLVLASVYAQGGGFDRTSFTRKLLSAIANLFFRFAFEIKVQTLSSFYRIYNIRLIRNIKTHNTTIIHEKGFLCMIEILLKGIRLNARIIEVPMVLKSKARRGKSKMKLIKTSIGYIVFLLKNYKRYS